MRDKEAVEKKRYREHKLGLDKRKRFNKKIEKSKNIKSRRKVDKINKKKRTNRNNGDKDKHRCNNKNNKRMNKNIKLIINKQINFDDALLKFWPWKIEYDLYLSSVTVDIPKGYRNVWECMYKKENLPFSHSCYCHHCMYEYFFRKYTTDDVYEFIDSLDVIVYDDKENNKKVNSVKDNLKLKSINKTIKVESKNNNKLLLNNFPSETRDERNWVNIVGHVIPTKEAINELCNRLPSVCRCISVGSGHALIEYLVSESWKGISVLATDAYPQDFAFMPVKVCRAGEIDWSAGYNCLFLIWPLPWSDYDWFSLKYFRGKYVVFVGFHEDYNAMTYRVGSRIFLREINRKKNWNLIWRYELPSYPSRKYYPVLFLYERVQQRSRTSSMPRNIEGGKDGAIVRENHAMLKY